MQSQEDKDTLGKEGKKVYDNEMLKMLHRYGILLGSYSLTSFAMAHEPDSKAKSLYAFSWFGVHLFTSMNVYVHSLQTEWPILVLDSCLASAFAAYLHKVGFSFKDFKSLFA